MNYTIVSQNDVPDIFKVCVQQVWIPGVKADPWFSFVHILKPVHSWKIVVEQLLCKVIKVKPF